MSDVNRALLLCVPAAVAVTVLGEVVGAPAILVVIGAGLGGFALAWGVDRR